jgi:hypothetical protein
VICPKVRATDRSAGHLRSSRRAQGSGHAPEGRLGTDQRVERVEQDEPDPPPIRVPLSRVSLSRTFAHVQGRRQEDRPRGRHFSLSVGLVSSVMGSRWMSLSTCHRPGVVPPSGRRSLGVAVLPPTDLRPSERARAPLSRIARRRAEPAALDRLPAPPHSLPLLRLPPASHVFPALGRIDLVPVSSGESAPPRPALLHPPRRGRPLALQEDAGARLQPGKGRPRLKPGRAAEMEPHEQAERNAHDQDRHDCRLGLERRPRAMHRPPGATPSSRAGSVGSASSEPNEVLSSTSLLASLGRNICVGEW